MQTLKKLKIFQDDRTKKYKNLSRIAVEECEALYQELNSIFVKLPNVYPEWETNFPDLINQFEEADIQRNELWYRFYTNSNPVVDKSSNSKL